MFTIISLPSRLGDAAGTLRDVTVNVFSRFVQLFSILVITFLLLMDGHRILEFGYRQMSPQREARMRMIADDISEAARAGQRSDLRRGHQYEQDSPCRCSVDCGTCGSVSVRGSLCSRSRRAQRRHAPSAGKTRSREHGEWGHPHKPKKGNIKLGVEMQIEGTADKDVPVNPFYAKVTDADGYSYTSTFGGCDPELKSVRVNKGEKARGWVTFEVPDKAKDLKLTYNPCIISTVKQEVKFDLGR